MRFAHLPSNFGHKLAEKVREFGTGLNTIHGAVSLLLLTGDRPASSSAGIVQYSRQVGVALQDCAPTECSDVPAKYFSAGGASSRQAPQQQGQRGPRHVSTETFFALLDPVRLLARFNSGRPLAGAAGDGLVYAWAPTGPFWNSLAEAMARESDAEGEIALGGTTAPASEADGAFELLVSRDEGASWTSLPLSRFEGAGRKRSIVPYPVSIAATPPQGIVLFAATDRDGRSWREAWRWMQ